MYKNGFEMIPVEEAICHKNKSIIYTDKYWVVQDGYMLFFRGIIPLCNASKTIAERIIPRLRLSAEIEFFDCVYHHKRAF